MKLVIVDDRNPMLAPDPKLIAAISDGRSWYAQFKNGDARSVRDLTKRHGVDKGDVSRPCPGQTPGNCGVFRRTASWTPVYGEVSGGGASHERTRLHRNSLITPDLRHGVWFVTLPNAMA